MEIKTFNAHDAPDGMLRGAYDVLAAIEREDFPEDTPSPFEQWLLRWRAPSTPHEVVERFVATEGDGVLGYGFTDRWPEDDPTNSFVGVFVHPQHRRQGIGREMLDHALVSLQPFGVEKTILDVVEGRPWESVLQRWGMHNALTEKRSRLNFSDIDWDLMDTWIERAEDRASDYEVIHLGSPIPDEFVERWCRVKDVMNTAPLEELELADTTHTPEKWRKDEEAIHARGDTLLAAVAMHRPTGEFAGFTDVYIQKHHTEQAFQHDTAVDPNHRNKGLGRWIKAEMIRRIASDHPAVTRIDTWNAGSNEAMLNINIEMGFRPVLIAHSWQGPIETIRSRMRSG